MTYRVKLAGALDSDQLRNGHDPDPLRYRYRFGPLC